MPPITSPVFDVYPGGADDTAKIAAALASARSYSAVPSWTGQPRTAVVYLHAGQYAVTEPLYVGDGVDIRGDGFATSIMMDGVTRYPVFIYGVDDPSVQAKHRPDLFGILDTTAAPRNGARLGYSCIPGAFLQGEQCSPSIGRFGAFGPNREGVREYWSKTDQLTIDLCVVIPRQLGLAQPICGVGRSCDLAMPRPWTIQTNADKPGWLTFYAASSDLDDQEYSTADLAFEVRLPDDGFGVFRLAIQCCLRTGRFSCHERFAGKLMVLQPESFRPGRFFRRNEDWPFMVGKCGMKAATDQSAATPFILAGFHLYAGIRYSFDSADLSRLDGGEINDAWQFFDRDDQASTIGYFPFDDTKLKPWVKWMDGDGLPSAVQIMALGQGGGSPNRLSGVSVWSRGSCVLLGAVLQWRGRDLWLGSETGAAIGTQRIVMNYPIILDNCILSSAADVAYRGFGQIVTHANTYFKGQGSHAALLRGVSGTFHSPRAAFSHPSARSFLTLLPGDEGNTHLRIIDANLDAEDMGYNVAPFVFHQQPQHATEVVIDGVDVALSGPTQSSKRPFSVLRSAGSLRNSVLRVSGVTGQFTTVADHDNRNWSAEVMCPNAVCNQLTTMLAPQSQNIRRP